MRYFSFDASNEVTREFKFSLNGSAFEKLKKLQSDFVENQRESYVFGPDDSVSVLTGTCLTFSVESLTRCPSGS